MNTTFIFDMDGVIIDSEPIHQALEHQIFGELGINLSHDELQAYVGTSAKNMWDDLIKRFNLDIKRDDIVLESRERYQAIIRQKTDLEPIEGVRDLMYQLLAENFKLLLASSASRSNINLVLEKFGMTDLFSHKISGDELPNSKPHPEIFLTAGKLAGTPPDQCVIIEDSRNGVLAAKAAGMKCIGYANPGSGNQDLSNADLVISKISDLSPAIIRSL
ncbi:MAG: HAD family hydrolase [Bacteroidota bacterium]